MEEKIVITCDSGLDVDPEIVKKYGIKILPIILKMGVNESLDDGSVTPDDIIEYYQKEDDAVMTAPPTVQDTFRFFTKFAHMGYTVIHITTSAKVSAAFDYASSAAESFNKIHIIDSKGYSLGGMPVVLKAAQMAEAGETVEKIVAECKSLADRVRMHALVTNLKYMHSSGRINIGQSLLLSVFGMMPSVAVEDGYFYVKKNYRGKLEKSAIKFIDDIMKNAKGVDRSNFFLGHTGMSNEILESCRQEVNQVSDFDNIIVTRCGCGITTFNGNGCLVLCWVTKE